MKVKLIKKQRIMEAPLMDIAPIKKEPYNIIDPNGMYKKRTEEEDQQKFDKIQKITSKDRFKDKLTKLLNNFSIDIYVKPLYTDLNQDRGRRPEIEQCLCFNNIQQEYSHLRRYGSEMIQICQDWLSQNNQDKTLIIPVFENESKLFAEITPWMIFHAMFDRNDIFKESPAADEIIFIMEEFLSLMDEKIYERKIKIKQIEDIFTFGSARKGYFSSCNDISILFDMKNEVLTQCLTTNGFQYNETKHTKSIKLNNKPLINSLERIKQVSQTFKQEFINEIKGKIVVVTIT
jgi:hypothetical protein